MKRFWLFPILSIMLYSTGCITPFDLVKPVEQPTAQPQVASPQPVSQPEVQTASIETKNEVVEELQKLGEKELAAEEQQAQDEEPVKAKPTHDIPITVNSQVKKWITYFQKKIPKRFRTWLERSGRYAPAMRAVLKEYGLPEDLVYLAMIESGFSCRAYSRAHAVGPWQFIRGTGRRYGLRIDYWVDERRDPMKATHAAAQYLRDLYAEFGSWYLAAAGYNAGEGKIRRAIKRYKTEDFWTMSSRRRRYLKSETKNYVPKMIAAAIIAKQPEKYGFHNIKYHDPLDITQVRVHPGTSVSVSAKLAGMKTEQLRDLNPELRRWCTPPSRGMYSLNIPSGKVSGFRTKYAALAPKDRRARLEAVKFRVQSGDTLGGIAKSFGVQVNDLIALNPRIQPRRLRIGQVVYVPPSPYRNSYPKKVSHSSKRKSARSIYAAPSSTKRKVVYRVRKGDSLWTIAQVHNVNYRSIMRWNKRRSSKVKPGQKLVLYLPRAKQGPQKKERSAVKTAKQKTNTVKIYHTVRKGQSLWSIAQRHGVTHQQIKKWNSKRSSRLQPGQKLALYVSKPVGDGSGHRNKTDLLAKVDVEAHSQQQASKYVVRRGDSLWKISRRFKVSPAALRRWNSLRGNRITPGDVLTINP